MLELGDVAGPPTPVAARKPARGRPLIAWGVILLAVLVPISLRLVRQRLAETTATEDRMGLLLMESQAKGYVGFSELFGKATLGASVSSNPLNTGQVPQRLRFVVLAGELAGPHEALQMLDRLDAKLAQREMQYSPSEAEVYKILAKLYRDYKEQQWAAPSLHAAERQRLTDELGWFGRLALAPAEGPDRAAREAVVAPARRTALATLLTFGVGAFFCVLGAAALLALVVCLATGYLRPRFATGSPYGGVYAETFAVWIMLFLLLSVAGALLPDVSDNMLVSGFIGLLSLAALAWPVVRGVPWRRVRKDVGLSFGRRPWLEPLIGVGCYVASLPLLVVGAIVSMILFHLQQSLAGPPEDYFGPSLAPAHPIAENLARADWWGLVQILFLASVVAPLVEEAMFRGVLYRHLREATSRVGVIASSLVSALAVSFVFAVIHPQGWLGVPVLMALAFGFSLAREWRGSLVPAMVAHGLNNAVVLLLSVVTRG